MIVDTLSGPVEGYTDEGLCIFKGIPYAAPPVGDRRWLAPQPLEPWTQARKCVEFGPSCIQESLPGVAIMEVPGEQSEDCLYLNVWTPACDGGKRAVMVWIHGGGLGLGSASQGLYDGARLAGRDVVVVTINYRLGALGFLNLNEVTGGKIPATGNEGFLDQIAALEWVRDNVEAFGGDPNNVTIFGESAGSWSVTMLMAMPRAEGLFHRAIAQSGVMNLALPLNEAADLAREFLADLELTGDDVDALRALPAMDVLQAGSSFARSAAAGGNRYHRGVIDGEQLPDTVLRRIAGGSSGSVDLVAGTTRDEFGQPVLDGASDEDMATALAAQTYGADAFALIGTYRAARTRRMSGTSPSVLCRAIGTDGMMRVPCIRLLEAQRQHRPVWHYIFAWNTPSANSTAGAPHGIELGFVFGTFADGPNAVFFGEGPAAAALADAVMDAWSSFAKTGNPGSALGEWPEYGDTRATMIIGERTMVLDAPYEEEREAWEPVTNGMLEQPPFDLKYPG